MKKAWEAIRKPGGLPRKRAVVVIGKQPISSIWALGPTVFINENTGMCTNVSNNKNHTLISDYAGEVVDPDTSEFIWLGNISDPLMKFPSTKAVPTILLPLATDFHRRRLHQ